MRREKLIIDTGENNFETIREKGNCYVDKSRLISTIIRDPLALHLFTRPRLFGKTTALSMLSSFFDIRKDSSGLFEGLAIMDDMEIVEKWRNRNPVVFIPLNDICEKDFASAVEHFSAVINDIYRSYNLLLNSEEIREEIKPKIRHFMCDQLKYYELAPSLSYLAEFLCAHYNRKAIILIDDYDTPLRHASRNGYQKEMLEVLRAIFRSLFKTNKYVQMGVVTGHMIASRATVFDGVYSLLVHSVAKSEGGDLFGFTQDEVDKLLEDSGFTDKKDLIREWYDGYIIAGTRIYTPWDVLKYIMDLQKDPCAPPDNYWASNSGNTIIADFVDRCSVSIFHDLKTLIAGGTIEKNIREDLTYNDLYKCEENIWSLMYQTGYLTTEEKYRPGQIARLRIPNKEILSLFKVEMDRRFVAATQAKDKTVLSRQQQ